MKYTKAIINTNYGDITIQFRENTPKTVENFISLAEKNFYDGVRFHRVIKDFMIQTGDPNSKDINKKELWGIGGPGYKFEDEVYPNDQLVKGSVAMANSGPNTNGSQFFIVTTESTPWLNGKHTHFADVIEGIDIATKIQEAKTDANDRPINDIIIKDIKLVK
jgi:Peptidyl-prolyl cis-trans isomerase (rotamase) - cyclophilin family